VVYFIAVVVTFQKITTMTAVPIAVIGVPVADKTQHLKVLTQIAEHLGDKAFSKQVASKSVQDIIAKYSELTQARSEK
jgi:mannitol/fructose-specific phosphotransferase system IIA component (Ntr-type)